jgi:hypothetical protein
MRARAGGRTLGRSLAGCPYTAPGVDLPKTRGEQVFEEYLASLGLRFTYEPPIGNMRRSAVRTFERAGVPRSTAMTLTGHKTESIYRRYAIVDEAMQREAAARVDARG